MRHTFRFHVIFRFRCINEIARDIQIAGQDNVLAHLGEVPYACVEHVEKTVTKVITQAIAVGGTVDAK